MYLGVDQSVGLEAMKVFHEYQLRRGEFKTMKGTSVDVVVAACVYAQLERQAAKPGEEITMDNPALNKQKAQLVTYCQGMGRNTKHSAFLKQLEDLTKHVNFYALREVSRYVTQMKLTLGWPSSMANGVGQLSGVFRDEERYKVHDMNQMSVPAFTAVLCYILTLQFEFNGKKYRLERKDETGKAVNDQKLIEDKAGMASHFLEREAKALMDKKLGLVAQVFEKVQREMKDEELE